MVALVVLAGLVRSSSHFPRFVRRWNSTPRNTAERKSSLRSKSYHQQPCCNRTRDIQGRCCRSLPPSGARWVEEVAEERASRPYLQPHAGKCPYVAWEEHTHQTRWLCTRRAQSTCWMAQGRRTRRADCSDTTSIQIRVRSHGTAVPWLGPKAYCSPRRTYHSLRQRHRSELTAQKGTIRTPSPKWHRPRGRHRRSSLSYSSRWEDRQYREHNWRLHSRRDRDPQNNWPSSSQHERRSCGA
jgi:hypothetical protein